MAGLDLYGRTSHDIPKKLFITFAELALIILSALVMFGPARRWWPAGSVSLRPRPCPYGAL